MYFLLSINQNHLTYIYRRLHNNIYKHELCKSILKDYKLEKQVEILFLDCFKKFKKGLKRFFN